MSLEVHLIVEALFDPVAEPILCYRWFFTVMYKKWKMYRIMDKSATPIVLIYEIFNRFQVPVSKLRWIGYYC